ncbi:MAG: lysophospholipid acyltransferase family protein [Magnetococcales bacterium]|nr:lysophospholipid acyltransferase family protein [Magnetococcales bacterium]
MKILSHTPGHWGEWLLLRGLIAWIRSGEFPSAYRKARWLSGVGTRIFASEWAWANANLRLVYGPNLSESQRQRLARLAFENIFYSYMEGMRVHEIGFEDEHPERLRAAHALGRGVLICGVHIGCWEPGLKRLASIASPAAILYRHANNPLSEKTFMALRASYGVEWISRQNTRDIMRAFQEKKVVGFMTDINTREGAVTAPYLGIPAQCFPGPARLAMRFRTPLVPIIATRQAPGRAIFRVGEPIDPLAGGDDPDRVAILTRKINDAFIPWVHEFAEQYNWLHARWRARPDGSLWTPQETASFANASHSIPSQRVLDLIS